MRRFIWLLLGVLLTLGWQRCSHAEEISENPQSAASLGAIQATEGIAQ